MLTLAGDDLTTRLSVPVRVCVCAGVCVKKDDFFDADILMHSSVWWNASFPLKRDLINHSRLISVYLVLAMLVSR